MKEALLKKRFGIPALALVLLLVGAVGVAAWYTFATISSQTKVKEPLAITDEKKFDVDMYPGETNTWTWKIKNEAPVAYTIQVTLSQFSAPNGVSITSFVVDGNDLTSDLLDDGVATFSIQADPPSKQPTTLPCSLTITAAKDATPGNVSIQLTFSRGG
jgi:hypothetical protein